MPDMQRGGKQIRKIIHAYNDWEGTVAERAEERASHMLGLWARDGGGIPRFTPHVPAWEGKGKEMDMDGCSNGGGKNPDIEDGFPKRRSTDMPS